MRTSSTSCSKLGTRSEGKNGAEFNCHQLDLTERECSPLTSGSAPFRYYICCSASQADTASVFPVNRWPSLLGGRWLGTSTYLTLGTRDPSARAALNSMYGSNGTTTPSASSRKIRIERGMREIQKVPSAALVCSSP